MKTRAAIALTMAVIGLLGCWYAVTGTEQNFLGFSLCIMTLGTSWLCLLWGRYDKEN